jgi:branched-chain amino acid transport system substrate-binding protein
MWGGDVNWRTAMAYDATNAIIQGLKQAKTRQGLQAALADSRFAVNGATGQFGFEHGDRQGEILLVKIKQAKSDRGNSYQFFLIKQQ